MKKQKVQILGETRAGRLVKSKGTKPEMLEI